ncbi:MAG: hypothetical protein ACP5I3_10625 [Thermoproteus sp.]
MNRRDLMIYIGVAVAVGMALLNVAILASPAVYSFFSQGGNPALLYGSERDYAIQSTVWTAIFAMSIIAVLLYAYELSEEV